MSNQHTTEPWRIECEEFNESDVNPRMWPTIHSGEFEICGTEGFYCGSRDLDIANARRIVACVNACAGISQQYLEELNGGTLADRQMVLMTQRDELLAALENAVSVAKTAHECWDNDQDMKVGKYLIALSGGLPGYDKRTDEIHAAIDSVKGGAA